MLTPARKVLLNRSFVVLGAVASLGLFACSDSLSGNLGAPASFGEQQPEPGETFDPITENDYIDTAEENTSTFSIDVDNASYTIMRRDIQSGKLPAPESVRVEEYVNFFDYDYAEPIGEEPFSVNLEVAPSMFGEEEGQVLMRVGIEGKQLSAQDMSPTNLVFLIDVSGSMSSDEKLPLVKESLYSLIDNLRPTDTVGIVVYAGADRVVLEPTPVSDDRKIRRAIRRLDSGGSTNAEAGIDRAYDLAESALKQGGNNRVLILTDGDFNVGRTGQELFDLIDEKRALGITLTAVGYGLGNFNDYNMENIAKRANGNYFYVDSIKEAQRIFGTDLTSTIEVIGADVKIQVEFNADAVESYRLVGYENRLLDNEDFIDDSKDAGEVGPGHTVTAIYELTMQENAAAEASLSQVRIRYKHRFGLPSQEIVQDIKTSQIRATFGDASDDLKFAAAVTEYAEILRRSMHSEGKRYDEVLQIARGAARAGDERQAEFIELVEDAKGLDN